MTPFRLRRSVLYMPASNARALGKGRALPADALILDLEDSVAPEAKEEARNNAAAAIGEGGYGTREIILRINSLSGPWGEGDLQMASERAPDGILVPKISTAEEIDSIGRRLDGAGVAGSVRLWAMVETPRAVLAPLGLVATAQAPESRLSCLVMGTNDLARETGTALSAGRQEMLGWLANAVAAARLAGLDIIDGVYNDFRDDSGFREECLQGARLGMNGKTLIHPGQIDICNRAFSPDPDRVLEARKIVAAFALPENQGRAAIGIDGRMVELLHLEMAQRILRLDEEVRRRTDVRV